MILIFVYPQSPKKCLETCSSCRIAFLTTSEMELKSYQHKVNKPIALRFTVEYVNLGAFMPTQEKKKKSAAYFQNTFSHKHLRRAAVPLYPALHNVKV